SSPSVAFLSSWQSAGSISSRRKHRTPRVGNWLATLADPEGCGSHARPKSPRKVLNLKVGRPLDRVLSLAVLNSGPHGTVAAHLFQKKCAAGGPNLIAQIPHPVGIHWPRALADTCLTADDQPVELAEPGRKVDRLKHGLDAEEANRGGNCD